MKKLFSLLVTSLLMFSVMPMVFAAPGTTGGVTVVIDDPDDVCEAPRIFVDPTSAVLNPNAENTETAAIYDTAIADDDHPYGDEVGYQGDYRNDYIFTGEVMTYYVAVYDANGEDDIVGANVLVDAVAAGVCTEVADALIYADVDAYMIAAFGVGGGVEVQIEAFINDNFDLPVAEAFDYDVPTTNDANYKFFQCQLLAVDTQTDVAEVTFNTVDGGEVVCSGTPIIDVADRDDTLNFNPTLALTLTGQPIDFGNVQEGAVALSNTVTLANGAEAGSDVMMDMYISADDYFSGDATDYCPTALGIPADQFSYFATNGAADSSGNDGTTAVGLGLGGGTCAFDAARGDFTHLPVDTTSVAGMCRIINDDADAGLLQEGELAMSVTFRLDVPAVCQGTFDQGDFNFIGRVV